MGIVPKYTIKHFLILWYLVICYSDDSWLDLLCVTIIAVRSKAMNKAKLANRRIPSCLDSLSRTGRKIRNFKIWEHYTYTQSRLESVSGKIKTLNTIRVVVIMGWDLKEMLFLPFSYVLMNDVISVSDITSLNNITSVKAVTSGSQLEINLKFLLYTQILDFLCVLVLACMWVHTVMRRCIYTCTYM